MKTYSSIAFLLFLCTFYFQTDASENKECKPTRLSVNFLEHAGQVFLNGYPVNTLLCEAVFQNENFQFAEISQQKPFFGWIVNSGQDNSVQIAYRILVASSLEKIQNDNADFWDSGKAESCESANVSYDGKTLEPGKVYFWKVKTWDNHGTESPFSSIFQFKMAETLTNYATARYPLQKQDELPVVGRTLSVSHYFFDFGKDSFGRLRLNLFSKTGNDTIKIHLGEDQIDGRVNRSPKAKSVRYSKYELALKGGWNTYIVAVSPDKRNTGPRAIPMPEYTGDVTPFRYCEIEGYTEPLEKHQVVRESVFYPFDETESHFTCSDSILNRIWDLCKYSIKATSFTGVYIDGDRERIPYEADALINQMAHYSVAREYSIARYSHEYLIHCATWPTEWILQSVFMAWNDYMYTGNKESMQYFYDELKAKTLLSLSDDSGFISSRTGKVTPEVLKSIHLNDNLRDIVDWPHTGILGLGKNEGGETDGYVFQNVNTVVNAYHFRALELMAEVATLLGNSAESKMYSGQAKKLKKVFNEKLFDKKRDIYIDGMGTEHASLHSNIFPLALGLAPQTKVENILEFIHSRGMACSIYGTLILFNALYDNHDAAYALNLLRSTSERSWYNMIRSGSTITMEAWDDKYKPNQDWNHAAGAAPAFIIAARLMGIEPQEPGFRKIRIKPQPASLEWAEVKYPTVRGDIFVSFKNRPGQTFFLEVSIPANTTADIYLPFWSKLQKVTVNGQPVGFVREGNFIVIKNVGSGRSIFQLKNQ